MNEYIKNTGLPADIEREIEQQLLADRAFRKLHNKYVKATLACHYADAARIHAERDEYIRRYVEFAVGVIAQQRVNAKSIQDRMTDEDKYEFAIATDTIIAIADMLEYCIMDTNAILHRYASDYDIKAFDKMAELLKEAKAHMQFMATYSSDDFQADFADTADDIHEMVRNKVAKFVRSRRAKLNKTQIPAAL